MAETPFSRINACELPAPANVAETELYKTFHGAHCARQNERNHKCAGTVSIDARGVTMSCPLCGDSRKTYG